MREAMMVLDWGIGGLPLFQKLRAALPNAGLCYLSDAGTMPYGKQSAAELRKRLGEIAGFAAGQKIKTIAVACNAMSSVLSAPVSLNNSIETLSLIHSFLAAPLPGAVCCTSCSLNRKIGLQGDFYLANCHRMPDDRDFLQHQVQKIYKCNRILGRRIGVIGGRRTIESAMYQKALVAAGNTVSAAPAQELSALIEAGNFEAIRPLLQKIIPALGNIDALVLACTHYPAVSPLMENLYPGIELIDPGKALFDECMKRLEGSAENTAERINYYTTGDAELSKNSAEKAFGFSGLAFQKIPLDLRL